jgi:putative N6-adenine-specific DNA methylase
MHATDIPSGFLKKKFGFRHMPDHDQALWEKIRQGVDNGISSLPEGFISGSDNHPMAVMASHVNRRGLPGGDSIQVFRKDFKDLDRFENGVIICNPPYGIRMGAGPELTTLYKTFGDFLKKQCAGSEAYVFFGNREMIKHIGLKPDWKKPVRNGGLDARIVKYTLY